MRTRRLTLAMMALASAPLVACDASAPSVSVERAPEASVAAEGVPFDLGAVIRRVKLGYTWTAQGAAVGGYDSYRVRATEGRVQITPRRVEDVDQKATVREGAPLELETIAIERGAPLDLGRGKTEIGEDGMLRIDRGVAEERFVNTERYTEQLWIFGEAPAGSGDLVVRVRASGLRYSGWDEDGHHFLDEASKLPIVYGNATWIDGAGKESNVRVTFADGELVLTVPASIVATSAYPATLDPVIGSELGTVNPGVGTAAYNQSSPSVAVNAAAGNYFVVWTDIRAGINDIYGARVRDSDGAILDDTNVPISTAFGSQDNASVAFNGTRYLVVWTDRRRATGIQDASDIYGQLVNADATLSGGEIAIATGGATTVRDRAVVTASGTSFVVTWQENSTGANDVRFARVTSAGAVQDPGGVRLYADANVKTRPAISCAAANCLISFQQTGATTNEDVYAGRIDPTSGAVLDATALVVSNRADRELTPAVSNDGTNYLVVYSRLGDIKARRVAIATGVLVDGNEIAVSSATAQQIAPAVTYSGTTFYVVWQDQRTNGTNFDIYAARMTTTGVVTDTNGVRLNAQSGDQSLPKVVFGATRYFVVWQDLRTVRTDIYGARVSVNSVPADTTGLAITRSAARQYGAAILWDGTNYFVAYGDARLAGDGDYNMKAFRVTRAGVLVDTTGYNVSLAANSQQEPAVGWNGSQYFVAWKDNRGGTSYDVYGARISSTFTLLDANGFLIAQAAGDQKHPAISLDPVSGRYLVTWTDERAGTSNADIYGTRVDTRGASAVIVDGTSGVQLTSAAGIQERPDLLNVGANRWLMVWTDRRNFGTNREDVYGNVIDATSGTLTPQIAGDQAISAGTESEAGIRLAPDGSGGAFAVWGDLRAGTGYSDIYGSRLSSAMAVLDPAGIPIATEDTDESRPAIARNPAGEYLVVWRRQRAQGSEAIDLWGGRFSNTGALIASRFEIAGPATGAADGRADQPAVVFGQSNVCVVAYQRFLSDPAFRAERVRYKRITLP